ncbi:hypothetical protein H5410_045750 [Solanum commersonii]|uniref:Uncharacterized protein n=1 Tax=Solanum commersonii TaxID=4109 RepID=A0A9J5XDN2_SOLCO|nr:hypothetical protein H5410_045750 [Solanum commersonii]
MPPQRAVRGRPNWRNVNEQKSLIIGGLRHQGMSSGSKRVVRTGLPSNKNKRDLPHHLLVQLHLRTKVSTIVRIPRVSELNLPIFKAGLHKGVVSLLHELSLVGTTHGYVVMAPLVILSGVRTVIL